MDGFFNPKGIAIFGISPNPKNVARTILKNLNLHHYRGNLVGIGSKETSTLGVRIYKSIKDVKENIDLAVIVIPATSVIAVLKECRQKGIKRLVIMTAGFKELKGADDQLSKELIKAADDMDIRFIGPNCQGVINTEIGLCLPFGIFPPGKLKRGDISIITQSGTICWMASFYLSHEIAGVNKVVSIGNKMNVDEVDLLSYLMNDDTTRMIILHLESTERGRELFEGLSRCDKPVILFKTQVSPKSRAVAYSHTAAMADDDSIVQGVSSQAGVLKASTFRELIEMAKALSLPPIKGNRLGIVSASGGIGIMAADTCERQGMRLSTIPDECLNEVKKIPKAQVIKLTNPVDTGNIYDSSGNHRAMEMILALDEVDGGILSQFHPQTGDYFRQSPVVEIIHQAACLSQKIDKPLAMHFLCDPLTREEMKCQTDFPLFDSIEDAVLAMKYLWQYRRLKQRSERWKELERVSTRVPFRFDETILADLDGFRLLSRYEIPCACPVSVTKEDEIPINAGTLGYPVVLKAISPDFSHKRAHGAVALHLKNETALKEAIHKIKKNVWQQQARIETFLLQKMVSPGIDLIFGGKRDPHYGPVVLVGMGGSDVEEKRNMICYLAPVSGGMAEDMMRGLDKYFEAGTAGYKPLIDAFTRFSSLLADNPHIQEIDLNPVRFFPESGAVLVLDVRVKLNESCPDSYQEKKLSPTSGQ